MHSRSSATTTSSGSGSGPMVKEDGAAMVVGFDTAAVGWEGGDDA